MSKVMIHPATYENVRQAIDRAFEIFPQDIQGKKVLIKPNLLRASRPEEGIVTNPADTPRCSRKGRDNETGLYHRR